MHTGDSDPGAVLDRPPTVWSGTRRAAFMFVFAFVLLIALPFPLRSLGEPGRALSGWWDALWEPLVPWAANHAFHLGTDFPRRGSAETTWDYVQVACAAAISLAIAIAWALFDRGRANLSRLDQWLRVYLRLFLLAALFSYGWAKVIPVQFPALGPERLSEAFGEASPNGLLWAFMGFSVPYMAFAGAGELAAGVLLCFRRTSTLGALIGIAVMTNVVALNFAFDVGVKLYSTFYLLGLVYLAAPDVGRLVKLLVLNQATRPSPAPPLSPTPWKRRLGVLIPALFAGYFFVAEGRDAWGGAHEWGQLAARPPLYGLYDVESVSRNDTSHSLVPGDSTLWSRVAIGQLRSTIRLTSGTLGFFIASADTVAGTVRFTSRDDPAVSHTLGYARSEAGQLLLRGRIGPDSVELSLRQRDEKEYRLVSHRFHWVHNTSENR